MTFPWDEPLPSLTRLPVQIAGGWIDDGFRPGAICTWRGSAAAEQALVAAMVVEHFGAIGWSRSRRAPPDALDIALTVYAPDRADWRPWVNLEAGGASLLWQAPWPGGLGLDLLLGGDLESGHVVSWATTTGREDTARFGLLLLARSDVRFGRKRIWRLRPGIEPMTEVLDLVLRGPRWGWDPPLR